MHTVWLDHDVFFVYVQELQSVSNVLCTTGLTETE